MLIEKSPQELFDLALDSECGIEIVLDDHTSARSVRRMFYNERDKLRALGNLGYDSLSFIIKGHDLWIVPRDRLRGEQKVELLDCRPLGRGELPDRILSRGKSRVGVYIS